MSPRGIKPSANRGFTLIEVLIAATVLAVGLLGIGAMLVNSLQASRLALQRSQAVMLTADLAERIRANATAANAFALAEDTVPPAPVACTVPTLCTPAEIAAHRTPGLARDGARSVAGRQDDSDRSPSGITSTSSVYTISVSWTQSGDDAPASFTIMVQA